MENIAKIPNHYILEKFELRGENYGAEVLKEGELLPVQKILGDKDFCKLEKHIKISEESRYELYR